MNRDALREAYKHVGTVVYAPRSKMWICPECRALRWTCEDLGAGRREHDGWAKNRGERVAPTCRRHPGTAMTLDYP